jgi:NAD(P)-dependent dehydrogenase (short-subunit alcohol dehydrogenase family)
MRHNETPGGRIVCTASNAGIHPHRSYPEYNGAKAGVINYVRTVAPVLKVKDNVLVNCVCPGIVHTNIIPPEMVAAVSPDCMTPVDTIVRAYAMCLADDRSGDILECSGDMVSSLEPERLTFKNGRPSTRSVTVWDPLFKQMHGENSELEEAIA